MKGKEWAGVKERKRKVKTRFLSGETPLPNMIMIICFWLCISLDYFLLKLTSDIGHTSCNR